MPASLSPMKREQLGRMKGPKTLTGSKSSVKAKRLPKKFQKKFLKKVMKVLGKVKTRSRSKLITDYMVPKKHQNKKRSESSKIADKFGKEIDTGKVSSARFWPWYRDHHRVHNHQQWWQYRPWS